MNLKCESYQEEQSWEGILNVNLIMGGNHGRESWEGIIGGNHGRESWEGIMGGNLKCESY